MTNNDLSFLVGRTLQQVAVGRYQVIFHFDQSVSVTGEFALEWKRQDQHVRWEIGEDPVPEKTPWLDLLYHSISAARLLKNERLEISFDNQEELIFLKGSEGYESFQVTKGSQVWVY